MFSGYDKFYERSKQVDVIESVSSRGGTRRGGDWSTLVTAAKEDFLEDKSES